MDQTNETLAARFFFYNCAVSIHLPGEPAYFPHSLSHPLMMLFSTAISILKMIPLYLLAVTMTFIVFLTCQLHLTQTSCENSPQLVICFATNSPAPVFGAVDLYASTTKKALVPTENRCLLAQSQN